MADSESDLETDRLELALENLFVRQCGDESSHKSKLYCSEFCKLVEEHTGRWQVPLPQLKVLRTALCSFTKATASFPADCQHIHYTISSLALSFFELMLFFSKEEFVEDPLKDILDTLQECHSRLFRHRNAYLEQLRQVIKLGGPWESPVLQRIMSEAAQAHTEAVEEYLSSEAPVFLELRVRYLLVCDRVQEATALSKSCLENREARRHLYFRQAYLTCLYKASLHEHLHKEMAEIDGRDAVEILCNTECAEKDELLLSLCKAFLSQQLQNGDMYYIWDLLFIWSKLHLRAHPCRQGFLNECCHLSSCASNIRSIFPFIKVITAELGSEGVPICVELCARALQVCGLQADGDIHSLVCKTIAFLLPRDLEVCRACALLVLCQERSLEAYRAVCLLHTRPDEEPHSSPVRTNLRFQLLQLLKARLYFDPEFWNLLTIRTHCLELISDKAMKAAVLIEMEEEKCREEIIPNNHTDDALPIDMIPSTEPVPEAQDTRKEQTVQTQAERNLDESAEYPSEKNIVRRRRRRRGRPRRIVVSWSDEEVDPRDDDPEYKYNLKPTYTVDNPKYSLRQKKAPSVRQSSARQREHLSRCVKNQILKRKGRKKRWLQGLPRPEQVQVQVQVQVVKRPRGRPKGSGKLIRQGHNLELTYPDNEVVLDGDELAYGLKCVTLEPISDEGKGLGHHVESVDGSGLPEPHPEASPAELDSKPCEGVPILPQPVVSSAEGDVELEGPAVEFIGNPLEFFHSYCVTANEANAEELPDPDLAKSTDNLQNDDPEQEPSVETSQNSYTQLKENLTWKERTLRHKQSGHLKHRCASCQKDFKGLNVVRHAFSHLKRKKLKCIFCGMRFKLILLAKKHIRDHIDEMCKQPSATVTEVVNGAEASPERDHGEPKPKTKRKKKPKQTCDGQQSPPQQKSVCKKPAVSLTREGRIIKNLRILIKKSCSHQRKQNKLDDNAGELEQQQQQQQQWECFKDEQVIIKDGMVAVSDLPVSEEQEVAEGEEKRPRENGQRVEYMFHLCPSESCDKVFKKIDSSLIKHTFNFHIEEESVLERAFVWTKHKCPLCLRLLQFLQHYKDHMAFHNAAKRYFCYHLECEQRFQTHLELKTHIRTHQPLRPQCPYTDCRQLFCSLQALYDHEWRHYVPVPQKEDLDLGRQKRQNVEASWKQRVKIEELWLQKENKVQPQEFSKPDSRETADQDAESDCGPDHTPVMAATSAPNDVPEVLLNGHEVDTMAQLSGGALPTSSLVSETQDRRQGRKRDKPEKKPARTSAYKGDYIDVKDLEDTTMKREGVLQLLGDPLITEHPKTFKADDPSYAPLVKCTFNRIPPSAYLDESALCMRKRKSSEEVPPPIQKYLPWSKMKKLLAERENEATVNSEEVVARRRCTKCLSSFTSQVELEKHQSLNTCSSLFGFDSDDESKHVCLV